MDGVRRRIGSKRSSMSVSGKSVFKNQGYVIIRYHPDELNSAFIIDVVNILTNCKHKRAAT